MENASSKWHTRLVWYICRHKCNAAPQAKCNNQQRVTSSQTWKTVPNQRNQVRTPVMPTIQELVANVKNVAGCHQNKKVTQRERQAACAVCAKCEWRAQ